MHVDCQAFNRALGTENASKLHRVCCFMNFNRSTMEQPSPVPDAETNPGTRVFNPKNRHGVQIVFQLPEKSDQVPKTPPVE